MPTIERFVDYWNKKAEYVTRWNDDVLDIMLGDIDQAIIEGYSIPDESKYTGLRVSSLGKPLFIQAMNKLKLQPQTNYNLRDMFALVNGNIWEAVIICLMQHYGLTVHKQQHEVIWNTVPGHIDCMIGDNLVIDIKTMSSYYYKNFIDTPDDDRGYITQILCYREALGIDFAGILCVDKWFGEMSFVPIEDTTEIYKGHETCEASLLLDRAESIIDHMQNIKVPDDLNNCPLPKPMPHKTGRYLICPPELKYDQRKHLFWELSSTDAIRDSYQIEEVIHKIKETYAIH